MYKLEKLAPREVTGFKNGCLAGSRELRCLLEREERRRLEQLREDAHSDAHEDKDVEHIESSSLLRLLLMVLRPSSELIAVLDSESTSECRREPSLRRRTVEK